MGLKGGNGEKGFFLSAAAVFAASAMLYAATVGYGFVFDDIPLLDYLSRIAQEKNLWGLLNSDFRVLPDTPLGYYRPAVLLSLHIDDLLSGHRPWLFHLTNVLINSLNTVLVLVLARKLTGRDAAALIAALFFIVFPVHVEAVTFISCRTDLLSTFFVLAAMIFWWNASRGDGRPVWGILSGLSIVPAVFSKESALMLPAVLAVFEVLLPERGEGKPVVRRFLSWAPHMALGVVFALAWRLLVAQVALGRGVYPPIFADQSTLPDHPSLYLGIWCHYAWTLLVGWPLSAFYDAVKVFPSVKSVCALIVLVALFFSAGFKKRENMALLAWFALLILPLSGVVPIAGVIVADRYLYAPSAAFAILLGGSAARLIDAGGSTRKAAVAVAAALVLAYASLSAARLPAWKDGIAFYTRLISDEPGLSAGWFGMGTELYKAGRYEEALPYLKKTVKLDPGNFGAYQHMSFIYRMTGRPAEADEATRRYLYYQDMEKRYFQQKR